MVGGMVSKTVILNEQVAVFPDSSVAVYKTVVRPTGNKLPEACVLSTVTAVQASLAVGEVQE